MKVLSLFSNVGIAETYLEDLGVEVVLANELNLKRTQFYKHLYPETAIICGDITNKKIFDSIIREANDAGIDIIMATPPCQGMSSAGKQDPLDPRNHLIADTINVILKLMPKYVFLENVPEQLITRIRYNGKLILIPEYIKLKLSEFYYFNDEVVVNAKDYSVPQSRERSIFLLTRKDQKYKWNMPKRDKKIITLNESIGWLPQLDPLIKDIPYSKHLKIFPDYEKKLHEAVQISEHFKPVPHVYRQVFAMIHTPTGKSAFENQIKYIPYKKDGTPVKGFKNTYKRMSWDQPCNTVTTYNRTIGSQENVHPGRLIKKDKNGQGIYSDPRVLTLYEILIVSSLPVNWNLPPWASENFIRTVIGEGIPPLLVKKIFQELLIGIKNA
jgi:DNA (cytosine-5)-methyltransferase 1